MGTEALRIGITGPWITKSYLEMILERKGSRVFNVPCFVMKLPSCRLQCVKLFICPTAGVPRLSTPPLLSSSPGTGVQEKPIAAPKPIRVNPILVTRIDDLSQPWTRSPTKSKLEPLVETWHFISFDSSCAEGAVLGMFMRMCSFR